MVCILGQYDPSAAAELVSHTSSRSAHRDACGGLGRALPTPGPGRAVLPAHGRVVRRRASVLHESVLHESVASRLFGVTRTPRYTVEHDVGTTLQ